MAAGWLGVHSATLFHNPPLHVPIQRPPIAHGLCHGLKDGICRFSSFVSRRFELYWSVGQGGQAVGRQRPSLWEVWEKRRWSSMGASHFSWRFFLLMI